ncbi:MAG: hypothetical protein JRI33_01425 [Deltaproteobacteria bacterium]|nr:hypothetical protein [Deltaproteobacteria bacterium]
MSFETRKKVTAPRRDITGSPDIYGRKGLFRVSRPRPFSLKFLYIKYAFHRSRTVFHMPVS